MPRERQERRCQRSTSSLARPSTRTSQVGLDAKSHLIVSSLGDGWASSMETGPVHIASLSAHQRAPIADCQPILLLLPPSTTLSHADFMAKAPWYMNQGPGPSLSHHKGREYDADPDKLSGRYERVKSVSTKFRRGACPNCGAMHSIKDCLERPRKIGAKYSGKDIAPDELVIAKRKDDWDSKRDRWDGYDASMYSKVVEEHQALEEARRKLREEQIDNSTDLKTVEKVAKAGKGKNKAAKKDNEDEDDFGSSDESDEDEDRYAEGADAVGQKVDTKTRITVRNLRIREDTAKYLLNLDVDSAHYDPKTRAMRENPNPDKAPQDVSVDEEIQWGTTPICGSV